MGNCGMLKNEIESVSLKFVTIAEMQLKEIENDLQTEFQISKWSEEKNIKCLRLSTVLMNGLRICDSRFWDILCHMWCRLLQWTVGALFNIVSDAECFSTCCLIGFNTCWDPKSWSPFNAIGSEERTDIQTEEGDIEIVNTKIKLFTSMVKNLESNINKTASGWLFWIGFICLIIGLLSTIILSEDNDLSIIGVIFSTLGTILILTEI